MKDHFKTIVLISIVWVVLILVVVIFNIQIPASVQWFELWNFTYKDFNNWGDFFAGFFAPLAFLWLGYGIFVQRAEFSKMSESINDQKKEMEKQSVQFETQSNHMKQQIDMIMSQDLANWYSKYSSNMATLYKTDEGTSLIEINEKFIDPTNGLKNALDRIEDIENILRYNSQIENYFFTPIQGMEKIQKMLLIDYEVIHRKIINSIKLLYIKIAIVKFSKESGIDIQLIQASLKFSGYVDISLKEQVQENIKSTTAKDDAELVTKIFNNIINSKDVLSFIKVEE